MTVRRTWASASRRPETTSFVRRPVSADTRPMRQRVRRPEQRQPGEQRRHLGGRPADRRQQHRPAGERGLGQQLARRGAGDEAQRGVVADRRRRPAAAAPRARARRRGSRRPAPGRRPRGRRRRPARGPRPATQRSPFSATRPAPTAVKRRRALSVPRTTPITADPRPTATTISGNSHPSSPNSRSRASHATSPASSETAATEPDHPRQRVPDAGLAVVEGRLPGDPVLQREGQRGPREAPPRPQHGHRGGHLGAERAGHRREEDVRQHPAHQRPGRQDRRVTPASRGHRLVHRGVIVPDTVAAHVTPVRHVLRRLSVVCAILGGMETSVVLLVLAVLAVGLALGAALGWLAARSRAGRRRRDGRAVRGDAGPRPAQRPGARPRPAARLVAGRVPPPRRRAAARDPLAVDRAAPAPGARALGRAPPATCRRAGRAGRPVRLQRAGHRRRVGGARPRPDLVVHLVGGRSVVVDAKVPLDAYLDATSTDDDQRVATTPWPATSASCATHVDAARVQGLLALVRRDAGVRRALRAGRVVPRRRARDRRQPDRLRRRAARWCSPPPPR